MQALADAAHSRFRNLKWNAAKHQDDPDVDDRALPESMHQERGVYDHDGYQRDH